MITVIRIAGLVGIEKRKKEFLDRLRLRKKFSAVLMEKETKELKNVRQFISYGEINDETLNMLIKERGRMKGNKKIKNVSEIVVRIKKGEKVEELKPFFRLHPPKGGFKKKKEKFMGKNNKMDELVRRML